MVEVIDQQPGSAIGKMSGAEDIPDDEISADLFSEGDPTLTASDISA